MNDTNNNDGAPENRPTTAADDAELRALDERLAELRARGIIGACGTPGVSARHRPRARRNGALHRKARIGDDAAAAPPGSIR